MLRMQEVDWEDSMVSGVVAFALAYVSLIFGFCVLGGFVFRFCLRKTEGN